MKKSMVIMVIVGVGILVNSAYSYSQWEFSQWELEIFYPGSALNLPTELTIQQNGQEKITLVAEYDTKPFKESPYYAFRVGKWNKKSAWEVELVHHKLYLENPPEEIQHFEISHGYNLITLNRAWKVKGFIIRIGGGIVLAHPETVVRGKRLGGYSKKLIDGFYISGPTFQAAIARTFWSFIVESKFTSSYARVPIWDGHAEVPNLAIHFLVGWKIKI